MAPAFKPVDRAWASAAVLALVLLGACSLYVAGDMLVTAVRLQSSDPLADPTLGTLKAQLREQPGDEALKTQIRELDHRLRADYFAAERRLRYGGWALLPLAAAALGAAQLVRLSLRRPPHPQKAQPQNVLASGRVARAAVAVFALAVIGGGAVLGHFWPSWQVPVKPRGNNLPTAKHPLPSAEEFAANWHQFRGPGTCGIGPKFRNAPDDCDVHTGRNILWKAPIPLGGLSSPVVWGRRVFLTAADKDTRIVLCFDADTGAVLWKKKVEDVPGSPAAPAEDPPEPNAGWAAPTPVCDGRNVYAMFANMDLACFTLDGDELWKKNLGPYRSAYGYGSSLAWCGDKLIVLIDQGDEGEDKCRILALDEDGKLQWETKRPGQEAWTSPVVVDTPAGRRIIAAGRPWVIAYDAGGKEVWRAKVCDGIDIASSPAFDSRSGLVVIANQNAVMAAIRIDSAGDVTEACAWKDNPDDSISRPDAASPVSDGNRIYLANGTVVTCVDAATGKKVYEQDLGEGFYASPTLVGDRIYLPGQKGSVFILQAGPQFKQIAKLSMGEGESFNATPAFADGRIFIRGKSTLYCVGKNAGSASTTPASASASAPAMQEHIHPQTTRAVRPRAHGRVVSMAPLQRGAPR